MFFKVCHKIKCFAVISSIAVFLVFCVSTLPSYASTPPCVCLGCPQDDCQKAKQEIQEDHEDGREAIIEWIGESHDSDGSGGSGQFEKYEDWFFEFAKEHIIRAMMMMTEQLSAVAMQQMFTFGSMMDAKNQMDTQRVFQSLQAQAHKDYQTNEDFCIFGSNVRSLAHAEQKGRLNMQSINTRQLKRHLGTAENEAIGTAGARSRADDYGARWEHFISNYCDPHDNNYRFANSGLSIACGSGGQRVNNDIDYARLIDHPRTIDVDFTSIQANSEEKDMEEDIMALSSNLFGKTVLSRNLDESYLRNANSQHFYLGLRTIAAKRAVAEDSFNAIVGLKSKSDAEDAGIAQYLGAIMKDLAPDLDDSEIFDIIGENPSYYAQLELLSKRIYQNPNFYANLYDTPANVARKSTALKSIDIMLDRAIYESQIRREMSVSVMLSALLRDSMRNANAGLGAN